MEDFINRKLKPTESCIVCTEPFDGKHIPVALPCCHIFGHECIKNWLRNGRGNTKSCPFCRRAIFENADPPAFDTASIWKALDEQPPERLHFFLTDVWARVQQLWRGRLSGNFATAELLDKIILPALLKTADRAANPFMDSFNLLGGSWNSLGRPDRAPGLGEPLVRLAHLMSQSSCVLPKWLTSVQRMNLLFWKANASLTISEDNINWNHIIEAAKLENQRYFPLLHLYTLLISQSLAHMEPPKEWPTCRHGIMNLVVERCCRRIGGDWNGKPSNEFKDLLVVVFEELKRHQLENGKMSLRSHAGEEHVVAGLWAMAMWRRGNAPRSVRSSEVSPARARSTRGWGSCDEG
ncbi:hypothetical protein K458DRAFT_452324 [Lentithecium fluviatile CBS 122367]|uniref:RING-type domain-containing protein n=1 Tax=Lentithecium fluviatile CBS 122367 TaxID=1168545 RepID=A0A6G1J0G9_9PLEO|nr:hypothetical protein K458DRAFT_452324 [Lentithecium fluviatile CBS 122367]